MLSPQTVVELFYQTTARKIIISQIYSQQQGPLMLHWSHMMSSVVHLLTQLLYPPLGLALCLQPSPTKMPDVNLLIKLTARVWNGTDRR